MNSDLDYADHIVACAVANHNIDSRRIYVTGCSAGGLMASAMAVKRSNYVAAAAPNSGGLTGFPTSLQDPTRVPAVMTMHGGADVVSMFSFETGSERLLDLIKPAGGFAVDCNHVSGHCGTSAMLHQRAWEFMDAHPFGTSPFPFEQGLPANFPAYCSIW